jgi:hypothetical protein
MPSMGDYLAKWKKPAIPKPIQSRIKSRERVKSETQVTKDAYERKGQELKYQARRDMAKAFLAKGVHSAAKGAALGVTPGGVSARGVAKGAAMGAVGRKIMKLGNKKMILNRGRWKELKNAGSWSTRKGKV